MSILWRRSRRASIPGRLPLNVIDHKDLHRFASASPCAFRVAFGARREASQSRSSSPRNHPCPPSAAAGSARLKFSQKSHLRSNRSHRKPGRRRRELRSLEEQRGEFRHRNVPASDRPAQQGISVARVKPSGRDRAFPASGPARRICRLQLRSVGGLRWTSAISNEACWVKTEAQIGCNKTLSFEWRL